MKRVLWACAILTALTGTAQAKEWQIDYAHSKLGFIGAQGSETFEGGFKKFDAHISFDPDHPENGKIAVIVDTSSAYAGDADRDALLPQKDWFDVAHFPQAQFTTTAIRKTATGYETEATLSIRGLTRNVTLPFTLVRENDHWRAQGKIRLSRKDFDVGQGMFATEAYVSHSVDVVVDLAARPVP